VSRDREIVALHPPGQAPPYQIEVHHRIRRDEPADYTRIARSLNTCADVASIQHAYAIWGGDDGEYVLDFVGALDLPAVATLHTVPRTPTVRQRQILTALTSSVRATVVMSDAAVRLLTDVYEVDPARVSVIPHGVPELPLVESETIKPGLGLAGRSVLLSFGLLHPAKGYELAIDAMPAIVGAHPEATYVIVGATHPDLIRESGETYRTSLLDRVRRLGITDHVRFVDRFIGRVESSRWLEAADVVVTPFPDLTRTVSGSLSYAMGAGRAIVSTPYAYATEALADGRGVLVDGDSAAALASAVIGLLDDDERRAALGRRAYDYSRPMVWSEVGSEYRSLFARAAAGSRIPITPSGLAAAGA
jgi:glycosyltransferase involved in cell wall biosynthesis